MKSENWVHAWYTVINMAAVKLQPAFVSSVNSQILHLFFYVLVYFYSSLSGKM